MTRDAATWTDYAEALALIGNSLLSPMSQTGAVGLDPKLWANFPNFGDARVLEALEGLELYARDAQVFAEAGGDAVSRASVEYTRLFIGPPRPAAPPWETLHSSEGATVGFGEPTFAMQRLLREAGLEISNENNQYADHIGIELLYASVLCARAAEAADAEDAEDAEAADAEATETQAALAEQLAAFAQEHPLGWIDRLIAATNEAAPNGYIVSLLSLAKALLTTLAE